MLRVCETGFLALTGLVSFRSLIRYIVDGRVSLEISTLPMLCTFRALGGIDVVRFHLYLGSLCRLYCRVALCILNPNLWGQALAMPCF